MKAIHPIKNHMHRVNRELQRRALIAILAVLIATLATDLPAQGGSFPSLTRDPSSQKTVSTNQLLIPSKALQAAQRARNHFIAGRIDQAQKEIRHALEISPRFALALNMQGAIHLQREQFEDSAEDFHEAIEADPALGSAYLGLGMSLMARNRFEDALKPLDRATTLLPGAWLVYFETALTHLGLGDTNAALKQIAYSERFTEMAPERRSGTAFVRGLICIKLRDYDQAKKYLEEAVAFDPNGVYAALALKRIDHLEPTSTDPGSLRSSLGSAR